MQFALSTHLFHGERLSRTHLEAIKAQGFDDIEVFATRTHFDYTDSNAIVALGDWVREMGMTVGSMHAPICASFVGGEWGPAFSNATSDTVRRQAAIAETAAAMAAARQLNCGVMALHLGLPRGQPIGRDDNDARAVRRSLEALAEASAASNVQLALEVIPNDLSSPPALIDWLEGDLELDAGICLDFGHAHLLGGTVEAAEALSGHVVTTHVHDNRGASDDHLVPFAGTIDWPATLTAMWKTGYDGRLVFEVADHGDATTVLQRTVGARARLQAILADLSAPFAFDM